MKNLKILLLSFITMFAFTSFGQTEADASNDPSVGWEGGDILAGANTTLNNTSILDITFSPVVGYAFTNTDLVTASVLYTNDGDNTTQRYQVGYQRAIFVDGFYVGAGYGVIDDGYTSESVFSGNFGYFRKMGNYWYVSPKLGFEAYDGNTIIMTQLTFGFVL